MTVYEEFRLFEKTVLELGFEEVAEFKSDEWKTDSNDYLTYIYKKMI